MPFTETGRGIQSKRKKVNLQTKEGVTRKNVGAATGLSLNLILGG
jgi:hypothetical protein